MVDGRHFGVHPDENLLSAFAENALTSIERENVLEHLSTCARCRDVVFLAQQAFLETAEQSEVAPPLPAKAGWGWRWSLGVAGVLAVLLIAVPIAVHRHRNQALPGVAEQIAAAAPEPGPAGDSVSSVRTAPAEPAAKRAVRRASPAAAMKGNGEIAGSVADRSGAAVPGAHVTVRAASGGEARAAVTNPQGRFGVAGLPSGTYQVQVRAQGFNTLTHDVTVQASERASLDAKLDFGAASQTVTVSAGQAPLTTAAPSASAMMVQDAAPSVPALAATFAIKDGVVQRCIGSECAERILPLGARAVSVAASGQTVMALDPDGNVFLSSDQGEHWNQAKSQWEGRAVAVRVSQPAFHGAFLSRSPEVSSATRSHVAAAGNATATARVGAVLFELTNDKGRVWVSYDEGKTWTAR
jgi:hypothetical protein